MYGRNGQAGVNGNPGSGKPIEVKANILEIASYVSPPGSDNDPGLGSAWVMVDRVSNLRWAQVGWWNPYGIGRQIFLQGRDDNNVPYTKTYTAKALGSYTTYEVASYPAYFLYFVNGSIYYTGAGTWTPTEYEVHAEVHNHNDQMPGSYVAPENFKVAQYANANIPWTNITNTPSTSDDSIYRAYKVSSGWYKTWDKACTQ